MLVWLGVIVIGAVLAVLLGYFHESGKTRKSVDKLIECAPQATSDVVDFNSLSDLPPPVVRGIDDHSATATLTDRGITVSLEFRFNNVGEATAIFSSGRFGRFDGTYKRVPWEGSFRNCRKQGEMCVPGNGEVGWYENDILHLVWKGEIGDVQYQF